VTARLLPASICAGEVVDVAGIAMHFWAADPERAEAIASTLREAQPTRASAVISVRFEDGPAPETTWSGNEPFESKRISPELTLVRGDFGLVAGVTSQNIVVTGEAPDLVAGFRRVFAAAISHLLARRNCHVAHAAGFGVDDGCILVFGTTGSGKSTLALSALRNSWAVLSDDLVVLEVRDRDVLATGIPRPIMVPGDLVDDDLATRVPGDARNRCELPSGTGTFGAHTVRGIVVATHHDRPQGRLRELRSVDVHRVVITSFLALSDDDTIRAVFPVANMLSRLPAFELAHGAEAATRVADSSRLLDEVRQRLHDGLS
jgi:hypothetical protein